MTEQKIYLMMNKPCGYVCSAVSDSHKTIYELLPQQLQNLVQNAKRGQRLHTVGRLDCNTSGLILLTNDGSFSNSLTRPQNKITKTYEVTLETPVDQIEKQNEYIRLAGQGLLLPPEKKAPEQKSAGAVIKFLFPTSCLITVTEGKFHEVRRIFRALGNTVTALKRIAMGPFALPKDLLPGQYQKLPDQKLPDNTALL